MLVKFLTKLWKDERGEVGVEDKTSETPSTEKETKEKTEETHEDGKEKKEVVLDADTQKAVDFYKALTGPQGMKVLEKVAEQFDMKLTTEKDVRRVIEKATSIFDEELGEEYAFLAPKLEKAVDRYIKEKVEPKIADAAKSTAEQRFNTELHDFYRRNRIPDSEKSEVYKLIDKASERLALNGDDIGGYLDDLWSLVSSKNSGLKEKIEKVTRQRRNLEDEDIPSYGSGEFTIKSGPKNPTVEEAVEAALRGEKWE